MASSEGGGGSRRGTSNAGAASSDDGLGGGRTTLVPRAESSSVGPVTGMKIPAARSTVKGDSSAAPISLHEGLARGRLRIRRGQRGAKSFELGRTLTQQPRGERLVDRLSRPSVLARSQQPIDARQ